MSTSYFAVCDPCKEFFLIGTEAAAQFFSGCGSNDHEGRAFIVHQLIEHMSHGTLTLVNEHQVDAKGSHRDQGYTEVESP